MKQANCESNEYLPKGIFNSLYSHDYSVATANEDGLLCCWLCMIDKYHYGKDWISYRTIPPIYSNEHWTEHFLTFHNGIDWSKYTQFLDHTTPKWLLQYEERKLRRKRRELKELAK